MSTTRKVGCALLFFQMGLALAVYVHWPALTNPLVYKSDVHQSPHWAAYHTDSFRDDDLIVELGAYNESPLQNLIYYVGTFAVDMVTLGKLLAVVGYGLTAALFFWLGESMLGFRGGALAAVFFIFFPEHFDYFAGGFSKAWMIPLIFVCFYLLETHAWRGLLWLMPLGALAYPTSAVFMGGAASTYLVLQAPTERRRIVPRLWILAVASALALAVLLIKYLWPPEFIGPLTPGGVLREMPEMYTGGTWHYLPVPPLTWELTRHVAYPFVLFSTVVFFLHSKNKGVAWSRPMTAFFLASAWLYIAAELLFMRLYVPNRYTRYSIAVLLVLWCARNWDRVLDSIPRRAVRVFVLALVLALCGVLFPDTFKMGKDTGNREDAAPLSRFVATLPKKVLIAGHPSYMEDIPILARRSVLCNLSMAHPWYRDYYREVRRRTEATFDAYYARTPERVNRLADEWGVTHLVVVKRYLTRQRIADGDIFVNPYNDYIERTAAGEGRFLLADPPRQKVVYENRELYVIELPLEPDPGAH